MRTSTPNHVTHLEADEVFVFPSNLAGRHGKGCALTALKRFGAVYGRGVGPQGQCYAIPTKDGELEVLPLPVIEKYVDGFLHYARTQPHKTFLVTQIGCGLAAYKPKEIAPLFVTKALPPNVVLPASFTGTAEVHDVGASLLPGFEGFTEPPQRSTTELPSLRAISIRGPWWWWILRPDLTDPEERATAEKAGHFKDVENRNWPAWYPARQFRGQCLVHASSGMTEKEYERACEFAQANAGVKAFPQFAELLRGGIVGQVVVTDLVSTSTSGWFMGPDALVLAEPRVLPFVPCRGSLGFFDPRQPLAA